MKSRKVSDIEKVLTSKGFQKSASKTKTHHAYLSLMYDGKKTHIYTYLSHGAKSSDYSKGLMSAIKKQLKFQDTKKAEDFLDCPMSEEQYIKMLQKQGEL